MLCRLVWWSKPRRLFTVTSSVNTPGTWHDQPRRIPFVVAQDVILHAVYGIHDQPCFDHRVQVFLFIVVQQLGGMLSWKTGNPSGKAVTNSEL